MHITRVETKLQSLHVTKMYTQTTCTCAYIEQCQPTPSNLYLCSLSKVHFTFTDNVMLSPVLSVITCVSYLCMVYPS